MADQSQPQNGGRDSRRNHRKRDRVFTADAVHAAFHAQGDIVCVHGVAVRNLPAAFVAVTKAAGE